MSRKPSAVQLLREFVKQNEANKPPVDSKALEQKLFDEKMRELDAKDGKSKASGPIPKFFFKPRDADCEHFTKEYRKIIRRRQLDTMYGELDDLHIIDLEAQVFKHISGPNDGTKRINYADFQILASEVGNKWKEFFSPSIFLHFRRDSFGRISCSNFIGYVEKRIPLQKLKIELSYFDSEGKGYLKEEDLEDFVGACLKTYESLKSLQESYHPFYICAAVRKFIFFSNPASKGKYPVIDLALSPVMEEFIALKKNLQKEEEARNWFSTKVFMGIYNSYLVLDQDQDGMLSKVEFLDYPGCQFTDVFVDRLYEELQTYDNNMDFKTYLDFSIAIQNKKSKESIQYFFKILDIRKNGYLSVYEINYFYREVRKGLSAYDGDMPTVEDVKDEIFDLITPEHPHHITLKDLASSGCGELIVTMLIDVRGFYYYDNRERFMQEPQEEYTDELTDE